MTSALSPCLIACVEGVNGADTSCRLLTQLHFPMTVTLRCPCCLPSCKRRGRTRAYCRRFLSAKILAFLVMIDVSWCWRDAESHYLSGDAPASSSPLPRTHCMLHLCLCFILLGSIKSSPAATATSDSNLIHFLNLLSPVSSAIVQEGKTLKPRMSVFLRAPLASPVQIFLHKLYSLFYGFMILLVKLDRREIKATTEVLVSYYIG